MQNKNLKNKKDVFDKKRSAKNVNKILHKKGAVSKYYAIDGFRQSNIFRLSARTTVMINSIYTPFEMGGGNLRVYAAVIS